MRIPLRFVVARALPVDLQKWAIGYFPIFRRWIGSHIGVSDDAKNRVILGNHSANARRANFKDGEMLDGLHDDFRLSGSL